MMRAIGIADSAGDSADSVADSAVFAAVRVRAVGEPLSQPQQLIFSPRSANVDIGQGGALYNGCAQERQRGGGGGGPAGALREQRMVEGGAAPGEVARGDGGEGGLFACGGIGDVGREGWL